MSEPKEVSPAQKAGAAVLFFGILVPLGLAAIAGAWWLCIFSIKAISGQFF